MLTDTNTSAIMDPITATIAMAETLQEFKVKEAEGFVCVCMWGGYGGGGGGGRETLIRIATLLNITYQLCRRVDW